MGIKEFINGLRERSNKNLIEREKMKLKKLEEKAKYLKQMSDVKGEENKVKEEIKEHKSVINKDRNDKFKKVINKIDNFVEKQRKIDKEEILAKNKPIKEIKIGMDYEKKTDFSRPRIGGDI